MELKFLLLPEGDDPDSFVRSRGADAFRGSPPAPCLLPDFLVKELAARVDFGKVGGRARFEAIAKPLLQRLPEGTYRGRRMEAFGVIAPFAPRCSTSLCTTSAAGRRKPPPRPRRQAQDR